MFRFITLAHLGWTLGTCRAAHFRWKHIHLLSHNESTGSTVDHAMDCTFLYDYFMLLYVSMS